jgi:hypothetical protein
MMQNALHRVMGLLCEDFTEQGGKSGVELIGLCIAKRSRQAALWVSVNQENFLSLVCEADAEIFAGGCLTHTAFLICYCHYRIHKFHLRPL